ncbi:hypothetical protein GlmaxMp02 [Olea europaea subsp. europaea]|uniref:Uncharacterized protein n=1 Tax=Olea europaea subsp. europaea TaxID=158383 RepID=A0A8S0TVU3_OLEEU|nr:hypothetical protein GlmaxMp02 [Olea europaea subsp. europaea]
MASSGSTETQPSVPTEATSGLSSTLPKPVSSVSSESVSNSLEKELYATTPGKELLVYSRRTTTTDIEPKRALDHSHESDPNPAPPKIPTSNNLMDIPASNTLMEPATAEVLNDDEPIALRKGLSDPINCLSRSALARVLFFYERDSIQICHSLGDVCPPKGRNESLPPFLHHQLERSLRWSQGYQQDKTDNVATSSFHCLK